MARERPSVWVAFCCGGQYSDAFEDPIGVYPTRESAEKAADRDAVKCTEGYDTYWGLAREVPMCGDPRIWAELVREDNDGR